MLFQTEIYLNCHQIFVKQYSYIPPLSRSNFLFTSISVEDASIMLLLSNKGDFVADLTSFLGDLQGLEFSSSKVQN